ncbi:M48 family metalloprotease [Actinoplanes sp. NPDC051494]|uniref:M48 family metallopeptidase n=1 Tax=Actinoplanes sp. NPDC051494 TaxID=3363907 RepID=UPI0037B6348F
MQKYVWTSAAALAGFLAVAALQLALVVVPVLLVLSTLPGAAAVRIGAPVCVATVGVMAYATWRALHTRRPEPVGIPVTRQDAPELWALLDGAAAAAGTRAPDRLTIVAEAVAKLIERTRFLGFGGGRRDFYLGLPLLQAWDTEHLRAVAAHEIGHFSPRLGRLAPLAYRGRTTVARVVPRIPRRNPAGPMLRAYAKLYRRADAPFSRAQELLADRIAAEYSTPAAAAAVLRDLPALDAVHRVFHAEYLGPGWQAGHVPDDIFGGFLRVLAARAEEVAVLRAREPAAPSTWDTHPPRQERLAALAALTQPTQAAPSQPAPSQPASVQPASVQPASVQPASVQAASVQAASVQAASVQAASAAPGLAFSATSGLASSSAATPAASNVDPLATVSPGLSDPASAEPTQTPASVPPTPTSSTLAGATQTPASVAPNPTSPTRAEPGQASDTPAVPTPASPAGAPIPAGPSPTGLSSTALSSTALSSTPLSSAAPMVAPDAELAAGAVADPEPEPPGAGSASGAGSVPGGGSASGAGSAGSAPGADGLAEPDPEPALRLVPDLPGLGRALQQVAYPPQGRTRVGWDEFFGAARTVEMQREADAALTALGRVADRPVATAADVLTLAADGELRKVAAAVFPDLAPDETMFRVGELVTLLLALAALHSGAARWRHSWTGTAELVAADGSHLDLGALATLIVDPATVGTARERLAELGIDVAAQPSADVPPARPEVVGGVVNLVIDGSRTDVLIVDTGLVLVPGLPRSQNGSARRRLARIAAEDPTRRVIETRFVAYADVVNATQLKRRSWALDLRDGGTVSVRTALDSDELPGGWAALDNAVEFLARTR